MAMALLISGVASAAPSGPPHKTNSLMLLQPETVLRERVSSVETMAAYIKALQAAADGALANEKAGAASSGYFLVAVRPGGKSKLWFDFKPALPATTQERLRVALQAVRPFEPKGGVVVFAINTSLWGAAPAQDQPAPVEWTQAAQSAGKSLETGDLVDRIWPAAGAR